VKALKEEKYKPIYGYPRTRCTVTFKFKKLTKTHTYYRTNKGCDKLSKCPKKLPKPDAKKKQKLRFVFETVRHGARAPEAVNGGRQFPVPYKHLTPMGMRQRYLLGRYMAQRVGDSFNLAKELKV
jgi:hypothetical protein